MAAKRRRGIEWVGGLGSMPAYVTGEGEPYRPEALFWMNEEGAILGHAIAKPGELIAFAAQSVRDTIERPMLGRPHAPDRLRIASPQLAEALRAELAGVEVVCAPTPEIDAVFEMMRERMDEDSEIEQSYLSTDIDPEKVSAFFQAAAALFRAKPWKIVPSDQDIIGVSIESLGIRDAALSVIGQMGQSLGFILFASIADFEAYLDAADAIEHGEEPSMPPHFALNFERGADLSMALRKEIETYRWDVAGADAYPWLVAIDGDLIARPASAREVTIAETIALALTKLLAEKKALRAAWNGGLPVERTHAVHTHGGDIEVTFRVPLVREDARPPFDLMADLFALGEESEEIDDGARRELEDELLAKFVSSPEGKVLRAVGHCRFILDFAATYFGATIATLDARQLREILFEVVPQKVSVEATQAHSIIEEVRAFYAFLKREFGLRQADACLRVLAGDAAEKLEAALSDESKWGMAKSLFMGGSEAGFDMSSKAGIETWMRAMEGHPLPASFRLPSLGAVDRATARAKKNKRKVARKARKKNR